MLNNIFYLEIQTKSLKIIQIKRIITNDRANPYGDWRRAIRKDTFVGTGDTDNRTFLQFFWEGCIKDRVEKIISWAHSNLIFLLRFNLGTSKPNISFEV